MTTHVELAMCPFRHSTLLEKVPNFILNQVFDAAASTTLLIHWLDIATR